MYIMTKRANGEGTFVTLKNGKLLYKVSARLNAQGKTKFVSVTGKTMAECKRKIKSKLETLESQKKSYTKYLQRNCYIFMH